jgi:hypothetical protein
VNFFYSAFLLETCLSRCLAGAPAQAAEANIGPLYLDMVAVVAVAAGGHQAGNMEVKSCELAVGVWWFSND